MQFTPEQHAAIFNHHQNLIVIAGAGSGKTRVLVERYLALLEQNPGWKLTDLVAITFTEKAAREMRERIRDTVRRRIGESMGEDQRRWRDHENLLDNARIGTIHSLCAQILRANPAEVPIDPKFEVLDENEAFFLKKEAVERALVELVDLPAGALLYEYDVRTVRKMLETHAGRDTAQKLKIALQNFGSAEDIITFWQVQNRQAAAEMVAALHQDEAFLYALDWQPPQWADDEDRIMIGWQLVHQLSDDLLAEDSEIVRTALTALHKGIDLRGGKAASWGDKEILAEAKAQLELLRDKAKMYLKFWVQPLDEYDQHAAELLRLWHDAILLAADHYQKRKAERALLDFDDLETFTVELLQNHPEVAEKYAHGEFKQVMVDEFQDTNPNQREIVYKLCGFEANNGRLFVVGDPKQSIYAFRGADVSVFNQVHAEIVETGGISLPLSRSFRTHDRLIAAFNELFSQLLQAGSAYEVGFDAQMSAQRVAEEHHHTPIQIFLMEKPESEERKINADDLREWEAHEIAQHILGMYQNQIPVWDKESNRQRPFEFGDAALLFRALTNSSIYEDAFKQLQLPYVTIGGRGYYDRQEVWDLINLLRALHNRADNLALASALRSPLFGLSDDALLALRLRRDEKGQRLPLWEALLQESDSAAFPIPDHDHQGLIFARQVLSDLAAAAGRVTAADLLSMALEMTAYEAVLTGLSDGDRRRGNVEKLLQKARASGRVSLGDFTAHLGDLTAADPREGEATLESSNAIKIMSVHRSKGLEFPLVVLADAGWTKRGTQSPALTVDPEIGAVCLLHSPEKIEPFAYQRAKALDSRREIAESKRLFYVAATRAQDYLLITGKRNEGSWLDHCCEIFGIDGEAEYPFAWGNLQVKIPAIMPAENAPVKALVTGWDRLTNHQNDAISVPPLAQPVPRPPLHETLHLNATQLEQLGSIQTYNPNAIGRRIFRQSVLHDAPLPIRPLTAENRAYDQRRLVGEIVHRALQVEAWRREGEVLERILRAYAWDAGVSDKSELAGVIGQATDLLGRFREHDPLRGADQILREVPFVYRAGQRVIHGIIDVLYRYGETWTVLDYKTALIRAESVPEHARRYYLQVGAYARAVEARTGSTPKVQLYYLYPGKFITIPEVEWRSALQSLDQQIAGALDG